MTHPTRELTPDQIADGWKPHDGGTCPIGADDYAEILFHRGNGHFGKAREVWWTSSGSLSGVFAYRVFEPVRSLSKGKPEVSEGENWRERAEKAEKACGVLKEALKPLVTCANDWKDFADDMKMEVVWWKPVTARGPVSFYLGDLRRGYNALLTSPTKPEVSGSGEDTINTLNQVIADTAAELGCENDNEAILQAVHDLKGRVSGSGSPVAWQWRSRIKGGAWDAWEWGRYGNEVPPFMDVEERPLYASQAPATAGVLDKDRLKEILSPYLKLTGNSDIDRLMTNQLVGQLEELLS